MNNDLWNQLRERERWHFNANGQIPLIDGISERKWGKLTMARQVEAWVNYYEEQQHQTQQQQYQIWREEQSRFLLYNYY